jgi:CDP-diacylglycerol--glycerol-3-phosphate 3-phosphatidyltransferase
LDRLGHPGREFAVTGIRAIAAADGFVISASKLGKLKTLTQVIAISALILRDWPLSLLNIHIGQPMIYLALILTVISGCGLYGQSQTPVF